MRDGWATISLGQVFSASSDRLGPHQLEPTVFSISKHHGVVPASEYFDKRVASTNLATYKRLDREMWAYSTIHIDEGSIARNNSGIDGVVSPMYTILRWVGGGHLPEYFELLLRTPEMLARYRDNAQGSINRRRSLPWTTFSQIRVSVPPLAEQHRIVDLAGAMSDAIERSSNLRLRASALARDLRAVKFAALMAGGTVAQAGELFEMLLGRQKSERQAVGDHVLPYVRAANISRMGLDMSTVQQMNFDPAEQTKYSLRDGDVLLVEGGSVGQSARWNGQIGGVVGFDKHVIRLRGTPGRSTSDFAFQWAQWCFEAGIFAAAARGLTIQALGFARASSLPVPAVDVNGQEEVCRQLSAADDHVSSAGELERSYRVLRTEVLSTLLSGSHDIPTSYDRLLMAGA